MYPCLLMSQTVHSFPLCHATIHQLTNLSWIGRVCLTACSIEHRVAPLPMQTPLPNVCHYDFPRPIPASSAVTQVCLPAHGCLHRRFYPSLVVKQMSFHRASPLLATLALSDPEED